MLCWGPVPWELHDSRGQGTLPGLTLSLCHGARCLPQLPPTWSKVSRQSPGAGGGTRRAEAKPSAQGAVSQGTGQQAEAGSRRGSPHVLTGRQLDGISGDMPTLTSRLSLLRSSFYCCESLR